MFAFHVRAFPVARAEVRMSDYEYEKVFLYAYPKMDELADAVSASAETKALLSFRAVGDCLGVAEKIVREIDVSRKIRAVKRDMDELLAEMSEEELFWLEYKYFRRRKRLRALAEFARAGECSERTYFRRQNALLRKISSGLAARGMSEEWFLQVFSGYTPFLRVYRALKEGRESSLVRKRDKRGIEFCQKSPSSRGGTEVRLPRRTNADTATTEAHPAHKRKICIPERTGVPASGCGCAGSPPEALVR